MNVRLKSGFLFGAILICNLIAFLSVAQPNHPDLLPDRIILNPTSEPLKSLTIRWRTDTSVIQGFCEFKPLSSNPLAKGEIVSVKAKTSTNSYSSKSEPEIVSNHHTVLLNGLLAGEKYMYRVGTDNLWSEWFDFEMPVEQKEGFSFIWFGDPQVELKSKWSRVVRKAYKQCPECSFMLYSGDIINHAESDKEWDEWFKAGSFIFSVVPQILTPGNHDYNELTLDTHWEAQFSHPLNGPAGLKETCFFIDYPHLRLISIDSAVGSCLSDDSGYYLNEQKQWLESVLTCNKKEWVILFTHLPFYSTKENRDNPQMRKHFQPILEKHKVDLVLTGHDHSYGRGRASDNPGIKPSVVYVVSVSGPKLYPVGNKLWMEYKGDKNIYYQKISITNNVLDYKSYTDDGELFDSFIIRRKQNGTKKFFEMNEIAH